MEVARIAGVSGVGGVFVRSELSDAFDCSATITFDWNKLDKATFTRVCTAITQGFTVTNGGPVKGLLDMLSHFEGIPKAPFIGYMGKKSMDVLVPISKAEQYKTDLIAAGHMMDVSLDQAVGLMACDAPWSHKYTWLHVAGWNVYHHTKGTEAPTSRNRWRQTGGHLKPATSKLANLVREWQKELFPERAPLLAWVKEKHTLTFNLSNV